jgi:hypothetical protein
MMMHGTMNVKIAIFMLVVKYVLCESGLRVVVSDISYVFLIALFRVSINAIKNT